jgi:hypothetical protein
VITKLVSLIESIDTTGLVGGGSSVLKFVYEDAVEPVPFVAVTTIE